MPPPGLAPAPNRLTEQGGGKDTADGAALGPPGHGEGAPGQAPLVNTAAAKLQVPDQSTTPTRQDQSRQDGAHRQVRGTLVVVVETPGDKYRRRCYLTLASAEAAVARAEAKGYCATVVLARLEPVAGWSA